jgi:hypothetical protein
MPPFPLMGGAAVLRRAGRWRLLAAVCSLAVSSHGAAQGPATPAEKPSRPAAAASQQADFGMVLKAQGGGFKNLAGTVTVPADWPDQQRVRVVKEDLPPGALVSYRKIDDVGRQMVVKIPRLPAGEEVRAVVTFAVERLTPAPVTQDVGSLQAPLRHKLSAKVAAHLAPSPKIENDDPGVRRAVAEAIGDRRGAWEKVEAIHRWVHQNIEFAGDLENVQTCMETLQCRRGVCAEMNSLTVAMLRAAEFPARLVRIPGHCYYEVYLLDSRDQGHWFAGDASRDAEIAPGRAIAGMILQKGDNVSIIDPATKRRTKGRFLAETVSGLPLSAAARLSFQPISPAMEAKRSPGRAAAPGHQ